MKRQKVLVIERKLGSDPWEPLGGWPAGVEITPALLTYLKGIYRHIRVREYVPVRRKR